MKKENLFIASDFDGSIASQDSLKELFDRFAEPEWREDEASIHRGTMTEREALSKMLLKFHCRLEEAVSFVLDEIEIDPFFKEFYEWTKTEGIPFVIVSGGFIELIQPLFRREGISDIPIYANSFGKKEGRWLVYPRHRRRFCDDQWHCKCGSLAGLKTRPEHQLIYIGDGHTDFCPAEKASFVFAKSSLKEQLLKKKLPFYEFQNFWDILVELRSQLAGEPRDSFLPLSKPVTASL